MSSLKYDKDACDAVVKALEEVLVILDDVDNDVQAFINGIPSDSRIENVIKNRSYKTRYFEDGTSETYLDEGTRSYYRNKYKQPIISASSNLSTIISNVSSLRNDLNDTDQRVVQVQKLIDEYELKTVDITDEGLLKKPLEVEDTGPAVPPTICIGRPGTGKTDLNIDTDGDGKPDLNIDVDGDGKADLNVDTNGDGKPDLNIDVNGDGKADLNIDSNGDGKPDLNIDVNGDGKADLNVDTNGDGKPDLNVDTDGDGRADLNIDRDGDGKPDVNVDTDGDGKADLNVDTDGDGRPDLNIDIDGDGKPDLNIDTDGDGKPDKNIDADGDGVVDPIPGVNKEEKPEEDKKEEEEKTDPNTEEKKDPETDPTENPNLFDDEKADDTEDGFADNIVAGVTGDDPQSGEDGTDGNGTNGGAGGNGGAWIPGANGSNGTGEGGAFPFLPGGSTNSDGETSDLIYRGLYDQSGETDFDMNQIKYNAIGEGGSSVAKGAAIAGAVGLGVSGVDAVAAINDSRKEAAGEVPLDEQEEKKLIKTIVSSSILGLMSIGYIITLLMPKPSLLAVILLGVAMAISSITAASGLKIGKYIGFGATLFVSVLTFILATCGIVSPIGYVVVYATFVILSIAAFLLDLMKGMFDDKIDVLPIIITIAVGLFFGMLKVLELINWIVFIILLLVTVGGYFLWDKVIKYKLPDDDEDEVVDNVIYKPVKYTENSPMNAPQQEKFDPRSLYKEDDNNNQAMLNNMANNQNPFANYNPQNSTFNNAFDNNNNNNNNNGNGMY